MPRLRLLILSFLCLLALATQAHANYAYIHNDHLGSASWITDEWTHPIQYIHYAPYGELLANQTQIGITHNERYKFTGKERDAESGYDYFGARFLSSQLGIWITPDPLLDKYLHVSSYMYCEGKPIKYVDPNGMWAETVWDIMNVMVDVASLVSNVQNGDTKDAAMDGVGLVLDVAAAIVPFVPGGADAAIKSIRTADKAVDAVKANKNVGYGQKVKGIGHYIKPNLGKAKPHGGPKHNSALDKGISQSKQQGKQNIRKNQTQVDANGRKVGNNRPDMQYDENGQHVCVEYDTNPENGLKHQQTILKNDPNAKVVLKTVE